LPSLLQLLVLKNMLSVIFRFRSALLLLQDCYISQSDHSEFFHIADSLHLSSKFFDNCYILLKSFFCVWRKYVIFYWSGCPFKHWLIMLLNIQYDYSVSSFGISTYTFHHTLCHFWKILSLFSHRSFLFTSSLSIWIAHLFILLLCILSLLH